VGLDLPILSHPGAIRIHWCLTSSHKQSFRCYLRLFDAAMSRRHYFHSFRESAKCGQATGKHSDLTGVSLYRSYTNR
jgi:hypothetical protein